MSAAARAAEVFTVEHGHAPSAVWSAPGRVNLIGDHTDYNDGFVLPFALPQRTTVAVSPRRDGRLSMATVDGDGGAQRCGPVTLDGLTPGEPGGWAAYPAGMAWVLQRTGIPLSGADLVITGDVPTGAGLSSSAALECAVALALLDTAGRSPDGPDGPSRSDIARWAQRAENEFVGAPTGLLDQTASLACTQAHALFFDVRSGATEQIPFDTTAAELEVLVIDTGVQHSHSESGYGERRHGCERAVELLDIESLRDVAVSDLDATLARLPDELQPLVRHVVTENGRVRATVERLRSEELTTIGTMLTASHASLRDDYRVSCPELDLAVDTALESGAVGARMTGGGFGGSAIALVHSAHRADIERTVREAFQRHRLPTPRLFTTTPSAGAGRDR
ncbi:galactokinase [Halopolyspora algeriensis]|uniref:Galactokinase n=1 Tax=Halopolyspora algeriensis TaxID=1500506 RepID=A0A368VTV7_9ACTN|nr:galactokinase [Halopolyspora algeriensis]RCW44007.1 galactokinase [Halopolyspora algeriensis]TQM53490.1 galactokinase [Halopolyspora algeriensis]